MKSKLGIILLLFVLNFDGVINNPVGAGLVPARSFGERHRQGQALPLQDNSSSEFLLTTHSPDGTAVTAQHQRKKRRRRRRQRRAESIPIIPPSVEVPTMGPTPPAPQPEAAPNAEPAPAAAPPPPTQASPDMDRPGRGAPSKKSAPRIKPPTVQIKPPTR